MCVCGEFPLKDLLRSGRGGGLVGLDKVCHGSLWFREKATSVRLRGDWLSGRGSERSSRTRSTSCPKQKKNGFRSWKS